MLLLFYATLFIAAGGVSAQSTSLTYLVSDKSAPFQITSEQSLMAGGLVTEIVKELFAGADYSLEPVMLPPKRHASVIAKKHNASRYWLTYGSPAWDSGRLSKHIEYISEAIVEWKHVIVIPRASAFRYTDLEDLFGQRIILIRGFDYPGLEPYLKSVDPQGGIDDQRTDSFKSALLMLDHGRGVAYVDAELRIKHFMKANGHKLADYEFIDFSSVIASYGIYLSVHPQTPVTLKSFINSQIEALNQNGTLRQIVARYQ